MNLNKDRYKNDKTFGQIVDLIRKEEEEALKIFNEEVFSSRVARRIEGFRTETRRAVFRRRGYKFAAVFAAIVVLVGFLVLVFIPSISISVHKEKVGQMQRFFVQAFESCGYPERPGGAVGKENVAADPETAARRRELEWFFKDVFLRARGRGRKLSREELKTIFEKVFCYDCRERERPVFLPGGDPGKLDLERRIEKLKKQKMIDHFLDKLKNNQNNNKEA